MRPEIISLLALGISALSLSVSLYMAWRTAVAERPFAWVELGPTGKADCWTAKINLRNRSKFDLHAHSAWVPIDSVPITKKQNFRMLEYGGALTTTPDGRRVLAANCEELERQFKVSFQSSSPIPPGETGIFRVHLFRSTLSDATAVKMTFCVEVMKPRSRLRTLSLIGQISSGTMRIQLASA